MEKECKHTNKAYSSSGVTLTCYPPINISYWICKDCGLKGSDSHREDPDREYTETVQRFRDTAPTPHTNGEEIIKENV